MFQEAEGEGLPQLNFTGIFTGRKVSMLKKDFFLSEYASLGHLSSVVWFSSPL